MRPVKIRPSRAACNRNGGLQAVAVSEPDGVAANDTILRVEVIYEHPEAPFCVGFPAGPWQTPAVIALAPPIIGTAVRP